MEKVSEEESATRQPRRGLATVAILASLIIVVGIVWLIAWLHPLPPRTITMVTGPQGSAYVEYGKRYQELLARDGINLMLVSTAGAVENLARLRNPRSEVQIGFLSGGLTSPASSPELRSLGAIAYEPLWLFTRTGAAVQGLPDLQAKRLSIGPEGSATRVLTLELLKLNTKDIGSIQLLGLPPEEAAEELLQGRIDAATMLTSWDSPAVQRLIIADSLMLMSFPRAEAYIALKPYLTKVIVPAGVGDLATNRPPHDVTLLATRSSLVVREDLHPALQYLLLEAAAQVHSRAEVFQKAGEFPAAESVDLPLSPHALHYYKSGRPFLQRYLPFWLAIMGEQLLVLAIPIAGILYPLANGLSALYAWSMRRRIFMIYGELRWLESELEDRGAGQSTDRLLARLMELERRAHRVRVASPYMSMLYTLKAHIELVRRKLERSSPDQSPRTDRVSSKPSPPP
jgi:TRAP transporter TAXI family solute receptor